MVVVTISDTIRDGGRGRGSPSKQKSARMSVSMHAPVTVTATGVYAAVRAAAEGVMVYLWGQG